MDVTGGWNIDGLYWGGGTVVQATKNPTNIYVQGIASMTRLVAIGHPNSVDVTKYTTLHFRGVTSSIYNGVGVSLWGNYSNAVGGPISFTSTKVSDIILDIDISELTGDMHFIFAAQLASGCRGYMYQLWLSKE